MFCVYVLVKFLNECFVLVVSFFFFVLKKKDGFFFQYFSGKDYVYGMYDGLMEICYFCKDFWLSENIIY